MLSMRMRVWVEKIMLVRHLRSLDPSTLARRIYEEQKVNKWPGLVKETMEICNEIEIADCNEDDLWKQGTKQFRKYLIDKCKVKDEKELRKLAEGKTKCDKIMAEGFGRKLYMSENILSKVRQMFYTRVKMQLFAENYKNDNRFKKTNWRCRCGLENESESHLTKGKCPIYEDLRQNYLNLDDDTQRTSFFNAVLERRGTLMEEDKRTQDTLVAGFNTTDSS